MVNKISTWYWKLASRMYCEASLGIWISTFFSINGFKMNWLIFPISKCASWTTSDTGCAVVPIQILSFKLISHWTGKSTTPNSLITLNCLKLGHVMTALSGWLREKIIPESVLLDHLWLDHLMLCLLLHRLIWNILIIQLYSWHLTGVQVVFWNTYYFR